MPKLPPVPKKFTSVFAERRLSIRTPRGSRSVRIQIGAPVQDVPTAAGFDWRCPIRFTGYAAHRRTLQAYGVDSFQSLIHALKLIQAVLDSIERSEGEALLWFDKPGHGFPYFELLPAFPNIA